MIESEYLQKVINHLITKYKCHTVILYGSRARGEATSESDYDLMGIRTAGKKLHIAKIFHESYLDAFIYSEEDLQTSIENFLYMKGAKVIYEKDKCGTLFLKNLKAALKKQHRPLPDIAIAARKAWLHKMLERSILGDIEGLYRRSWLQEALLSDYFNIRKMRYWGPKQSFHWLLENDKQAYLLFKKSLENPADFKKLKKLVEQVSGLKG